MGEQQEAVAAGVGYGGVHLSTDLDVHLHDKRRRAERKQDIDGSRDVQALQDNHRDIVRMMAQGMTNREVNEALVLQGKRGMTSAHLSNIRNSPMCREHMRNLQGKRDSLVERDAEIRHEATMLAWSVLGDAVSGVLKAPVVVEGELIEGQFHYQPVSAAARIKAATETLNRDARTAPVSRVQAEMGVGALTPEDMERITSNFVQAKSEQQVYEELAGTGGAVAALPESAHLDNNEQ